MVATASLSFKYMERFASIVYFQKTFSAQSVPDAQLNISKALTLYSNDLYLRTYSQTQIAKINSLVSKGQSISESDKADLQTSFDQAVSSLQAAEAYDQNNYLNFSALGAVYEAVAPLGVTGAYDKALVAYHTASSLNPLNPGIKFALARVSFAKGDMKGAKDYATEVLSLKSDYVDALVLLSQVAKNEGNNADALSYAQAAFLINPQNKNLEQYVNYLKNPVVDNSSTVKDNTNNKPAKTQ